MKYHVAMLASLLALSGCAAWKVDKSVVASPEQIAKISLEIDKVRRYQHAVYEVSTFAVDRCALKARREPFALITTGHLADLYDNRKVAAYWQAAGFDETWRVLWAAEDSGLRAGQRVLEINGKRIDNNKTGIGEFPLVIYLDQTSRARDAAADGKPYEITLEDGRRTLVKTGRHVALLRGQCQCSKMTTRRFWYLQPCMARQFCHQMPSGKRERPTSTVILPRLLCTTQQAKKELPGRGRAVCW